MRSDYKGFSHSLLRGQTNLSTRLRGTTDRGRSSRSGGKPASAESRSMTLVAAALRRVPVTVRIWSLTVLIGTIATTIYLVVLRGQAGPHVEFRLPWPVLAFAVAVAELRVVEVHFRRETHSFSLSEFPAVVGMFFLNPSEYIGALLVGSAVALISSAAWRTSRRRRSGGPDTLNRI